MADTVSVTQADRIFVASYLFDIGKIASASQEPILSGEWDDTEHVQAVARHRLASTQPAPAFPREEVERTVLDAIQQYNNYDGWTAPDLATDATNAIQFLLQGKQP